MGAITAETVLRHWEPDSAGLPHQRLARLLKAAGAADPTETLGGRNRTLAVLHGELVGGPIDAQVRCTACGADSEFAVPVAAIAEAPVPPADAVVTVGAGAEARRFRLPRMADLEARDALGGELLRRCSLDGDEAVPEAMARELEQQFEALDPAANVVVTIACAGCGGHIEAGVDLAGFVARDIDRLADGLYRDIDTIAGAYGWREAEILALPPGRRRRYVALIARRRAPQRPALAGLGR